MRKVLFLRRIDEGAVRFPDFRHFLVKVGAGYGAAGFVILQSCRNPHRSVERKRIVLQHDGLIVMSLLDHEHQARVALGLEGG